ncbi:hypothetical protein EON67_07505, partial [archaeon]
MTTSRLACRCRLRPRSPAQSTCSPARARVHVCARVCVLAATHTHTPHPHTHTRERAGPRQRRRRKRRRCAGVRTLPRAHYLCCATRTRACLAGTLTCALVATPRVQAANLTPLTIYFGTQTGTAERYGKQLAVKGRKLGFNAKAVSVSSLKPTTLEAGGLAIFLMATYGEGDPTDDAVEFTKWLTEAADAAKAAAAGAAPVDGSPVLSYSKLKFTVFGLGNKLYEHYNKMGKIVDQRLEELGGARVYRHGEGDDNDNLEDDFENWEADLWPALEAAVPSRRRTSSATAADVGGASEADLPPMPWMVSLLP